LEDVVGEVLFLFDMQLAMGAIATLQVLIARLQVQFQLLEAIGTPSWKNFEKSLTKTSVLDTLQRYLV